jgi:hypothetical protein
MQKGVLQMGCCDRKPKVKVEDIEGMSFLLVRTDFTMVDIYSNINFGCIVPSTQDIEAATEVPKHATDDNEKETQDKNRPKSAPNISLNIHTHEAQHELYVVAIFGVLLQTTVLVYALWGVKCVKIQVQCY